jgi:hypothetical protein
MALSEEELQLARLRAKAKLRLRQQQAAPAPAATPVTTPVSKEQDGLSYAGDLAQTFTGGTLAGWGDEAVGGARAVGDYLFGDVGEEGNQSFPQAYKMYRDDARKRKAEFAEANPKTAIATELAGGIASPINRVAPGFGSAWVPKTAALTTARALPRARVAASMARGAVEGGVAGLGQGEGSLEEQLGSAGQGAAFGGLTSGAMTGALGAFGNTLSKRRVAEELGTGEHFKPLNLADPEGGIGKFYRNTVANAYGGGGIGKQESQWLRNSPEIAKFIDDPATMFPDTVGTGRAVKAAKDEITDKTREAGKVLKRSLEAGTQRVDNALHPTVIETAMPNSMPEAVKNTIRQSDPYTADRLLSDWYKDNGFQMVKGRAFEWDAGLGKELKSLSENDPAFALNIGNAASKVNGLVERLAREGKKSSDLAPQDFIEELAKAERVGIDGDALMAMRNAFSMPANMGGPSLKGKMLRDVTGKFDNMIKNQLGEDSLEWANYQDELQRWGAKQGISGAVKKAKSNLQSTYTPKQLARSLKKQGQDNPAWVVAKQAEDAKAQAKAAAAAEKEAIVERGRQAKSVLEKATQGLTREDSSTLSRLSSTAVLGGAPAAILGGAGSILGVLPVGMGVAKTLSLPSTQRFVAGQTNKQKQLAGALRKGAFSPVTRVTSRAAALANTNKDEEQ